MSETKWTYWLWYGGEIAGSIRAEPHLSDSAVRAIAVQRYRWLPLSIAGWHGRDAEAMLSRSQVRTYPPHMN